MDNILVLYNDELKKTALFNKQYANIITISREVYEIIKDAETPEEIISIASEFEEKDRKYLESLIKVLVENHYFEKYENCRMQKIDFAVTNNCNLFCTHCCFSAGVVQRDSVETVDMEIVRKIVEMNPMQVTITGGEPLTVSNILDVIEYIKSNIDGAVTIATNATLINEKNVKTLCKYVDAFDISLDGINSETTDKIRGKGVFNKVMKAIELLKAYDAKKITVSMVFDDETSVNCDPFVEMCNNLGVEPMVRALNMVGRAKENHTTTSDQSTLFMKGGAPNIIGCYDCPGGVYELFVDCKGDLYPCGLFREEKYKIGNIHENGFQDRMKWDKDLSWFKSYSEYIPNEREECKDCEVNFFCWSCPSIAKSYMEYHGIERFKPLCEQKKKEILEAIWGNE